MNKGDPKFWALIGFGIGAVSASGVTYTCKASPADTRNRWRQ